MKNKASPDIIEKGSKLYWYIWHLVNEGSKKTLDSLLLFTLKCLTPFYYTAVFIKRLIRKRSIPKKYPIISIGNLTLGGTGKTPCVELLINKLSNKKRKVGILTKGYGRKSKENKKIVFSKTAGLLAEETGDEPYLFSKHFPDVPIFISRNRADSYISASKAGECDTFIMDDGFQYSGVRKDLEILLINSGNPFGNGHLFPAGTLREPPVAMKRADLIILTHADEYNAPKEKLAEIPVLESIHKSLHFEDILSGRKYQSEELINKKFLSLCSLADPLSFEDSLKKIGFNMLKKIRFPDHYIYRTEDIKWLSDIARRENVDFIATTEKDWVRFPKDFEAVVPILCLIIDFKITKGEEILDNMIDKILEKYKT